MLKRSANHALDFRQMVLKLFKMRLQKYLGDLVHVTQSRPSNHVDSTRDEEQIHEKN